jgi:hypothetical protein
MVKLALAILFVGHSLVSPTLPLLFEQVVRRSGTPISVDYQVINGSPLSWNWDYSATAEGVDGRAAMATGDFDVLVVTEGVPIRLALEWNDAKGAALRWHRLAIDSNPEARTFLYESWHDLRSDPDDNLRDDASDLTPWRQRLDADLALWESIVDSVNAASPADAPKMQLVPAGQGMARLYDAIAAGTVPGLSSIRDIFSDDIHPNTSGFYFVAMVHYAAIYGRSPVGVPHRLVDAWGTPYETPDRPIATRMQEIAWETVRDYREGR